MQECVFMLYESKNLILIYLNQKVSALFIFIWIKKFLETFHLESFWKIYRSFRSVDLECGFHHYCGIKSQIAQCYRERELDFQGFYTLLASSEEGKINISDEWA